MRITAEINPENTDDLNELGRLSKYQDCWHALWDLRELLFKDGMVDMNQFEQVLSEYKIDLEEWSSAL